jgi:hypothetical protein
LTRRRRRRRRIERWSGWLQGGIVVVVSNHTASSALLLSLKCRFWYPARCFLFMSAAFPPDEARVQPALSSRMDFYEVRLAYANLCSYYSRKYCDSYCYFLRLTASIRSFVVSERAAMVLFILLGSVQIIANSTWYLFYFFSFLFR